MEPKEVDALISLLDDDDREVFQHVTDQLMSLGTPIIPRLESAWETSLDPELQERLEQVIHRIQLQYTLSEFSEWLNEPDHRLLDGALIVSKFQYPDLDTIELKRKVDVIRREIWVELNEYLSPLEQVNVFNQVFYKIENFGGNTSEATDPSSFYLNLVIESKKGNPMSLGILYQALAEQLDLSIYGVNLPHHFCLAYMKVAVQDLSTVQEKDVLFYINPLNTGLIFTRNEITEFLVKLGLPEKPEYFTPSSNKNIIRSLITNMREAYRTVGQEEKAKELGQFLELMDAAV